MYKVRFCSPFKMFYCSNMFQRCVTINIPYKLIRFAIEVFFRNFFLKILRNKVAVVLVAYIKNETLTHNLVDQ